MYRRRLTSLLVAVAASIALIVTTAGASPGVVNGQIAFDTGLAGPTTVSN